MITKPYPRELYNEFCLKLGQINPLLCLLDVSAQRFAAEMNSSAHPAKFIRDESIRFKHYRLYTDNIKFEDSQRFLYISHIAFLLTCTEAVCRRIQHHPLVNKEELSENTGNFIQRTVRVVLLTATNKSQPNPTPLEDIQTLVGEATYALVDYYRLVRNAELHAKDVGDEDRSPVKAHQSLPTNSIAIQYKRQPSAPSSICFTDALLCSLALQDLVKKLCVGLVGIEKHVIPHIQKTFGTLTGKRRINASLAFCHQALLLDEQQAKYLLNSFGWLA